MLATIGQPHPCRLEPGIEQVRVYQPSKGGAAMFFAICEPLRRGGAWLCDVGDTPEEAMRGALRARARAERAQRPGSAP